MICRICDSSNLELAVDLGEQPWANNFLRADQVGHEAYYPLRVVFCQKCHTAQLDYTVRKEVMFADHTYLSGITSSLSEHFRRTAAEVDSKLFADRKVKSVLDIGSNDGTQLKHYQSLGYEVLGVESSKTTAALANDAGVPTLNCFFNEATAQSIGRKFEIINASGVFFHLEELHSVTEGIRECLTDDGVFAVQFLYMKQIIANGAFDQIYHEHLLYYNLETIDVLLRRHGLALFDAYLSPIHGGSIIAYACKQPGRPQSSSLISLLAAEAAERSNTIEVYRTFAQQIEVMKARNLDDLHARKSAGKVIYGFGAPVKGNTLLNYFQIGSELLNCLVEKNELRRGLYSPGQHLPIRIERELEAPPDVYYVLAWNFRDEILKNNQPLIERGVEFYFPVISKVAV